MWSHMSECYKSQNIRTKSFPQSSHFLLPSSSSRVWFHPPSSAQGGRSRLVGVVNDVETPINAFLISTPAKISHLPPLGLHILNWTYCCEHFLLFPTSFLLVVSVVAVAYRPVNGQVCILKKKHVLLYFLNKYTAYFVSVVYEFNELSPDVLNLGCSLITFTCDSIFFPLLTQLFLYIKCLI